MAHDSGHDDAPLAGGYPGDEQELSREYPRPGDRIKVRLAIGNNGSTCVVLDGPEVFWMIANDGEGDLYFNDCVSGSDDLAGGVYDFIAEYTSQQTMDGESEEWILYWDLREYTRVPMPGLENDDE